MRLLPSGSVSIPLLLLSCDSGSRELLDAQRIHQDSIAQVSALLPYLTLPPAPSAAAREAASLARAGIVKAALNAADAREPLGVRRPLRSAERLAHAFGAVVRPCAVSTDEPPELQLRRAHDCRRALESLDGALLIEDRLASRHGLPAGTVPHLSPPASSPAALAAEAPARALLTPSPSESQRRRLWQDPHATEDQLGAACRAALAESAQRSRAVAQDIEASCATLEDVVRQLGVFARCRADSGPGCPGTGPCAALRGSNQQKAVVPAALHGQIEEALKTCDQRMRQMLALPPAP